MPRMTPRQLFAQQAAMQHQAIMAQRMAKMGGMNNADKEQVLLNAQKQELLRQKHETMRNRYPDTRYKRPSQAMMPQKGQYQGPGAYVPPKPISNKVAANPKLKRPNQPIEVLPTPRMDRMPGGNGPEPLIPRERYMNTKPSGIQKLPSPKRDRMPDLRQDTHPYIQD